MKRVFSLFLCLLMLAGLLSGCAEAPESSGQSRIITDSLGRQVSIPDSVDSVVCVGVGALRYTCYMNAAHLVVGVEDYETQRELSRLYNYVNYDSFKDLPVTGTNGVPYGEQILDAAPQVVVMSKSASCDPEQLQEQTGIPVVVIPGSDSTLDDNTYETIRILGELYHMEERASQLTQYLQELQQDLARRTQNIPEAQKPSVYVGGVSFRGVHGFEGTEANYGPFHLIHAKNLADATDQTGAFDIDPEQVLSWDPDILFLDFNGMDLIRQDYAENPEFYQALTAVQNGRVYSQISFRAYASNLDTALADAYYAGSVIYPEQFADIDPVEKAGEIFTMLLGSDPYPALKEAGYEFCTISIDS